MIHRFFNTACPATKVFRIGYGRGVQTHLFSAGRSGAPILGPAGLAFFRKDKAHTVLLDSVIINKRSDRRFTKPEALYDEGISHCPAFFAAVELC